jgi:large subunit ribosomal protein L1
MSCNRGKKYKQAKESVVNANLNDCTSALKAVVSNSFAKFDESVGLDIVLGIDPTKGDQVVRGSVMLPHGTGKKIVVAAFVKEGAEKAAKDAGADIVGGSDLIAKVEKGFLDFSVAVATPDMMVDLAKVAKILGPRGLLPNKKTGTVAIDISEVISDLKKGRLSFRNDKGGGMHASFGKVSFGDQKLKENLNSLLVELNKNKPPASKGKFIKRVVVSSTHGIGIPLNFNEFFAAKEAKK